MQVYDAVIDLVGPVPEGFEVLVWVFSCLILFFLVRSVFGILASVLGWMGGRRDG